MRLSGDEEKGSVSICQGGAGGDQNRLQQPADDRKSADALVQSGLDTKVVN